MASSRSSVRSKVEGRRFGREEPRVFTPPLRELTPRTSAGFAAIEFASDILGIELFPWQKFLLIHGLELLPDGLFRFRTVVILVARQNGKSTLAQVLSLFFLYVRSAALVIGTAQNLDIAEEVWQGAVDIAEDTPDLADEIKKVVRVNGKKSLELVSGQRYKVQAANRRGGRGLSGDLVILDELREHQSWDAWGAVTKTTLARALAQIWTLSNAGDATSVVLRHLRKIGHRAVGDPDGINEEIGVPGAAEDLLVGADAVEAAEGVDDDSLGIFEWSAPPGCDIWDRDGWAYANPSLGYTLSERALASAAKTDPEWVFRTECLCQWSDGALEGPFPSGAWDAAMDPMSSIPDGAPVAFCVDVSADRSHAHIGVAGRRSDGHMHIEIAASRIGTDWVRDWFSERASASSPMRVTGQAKGAPVSGLLEELAGIENVDVVDWSGSQLGIATGKLWDMVARHVAEERPETLVFHRPQPVLDVAAAVAATRPAGDGAWLWDRVKSVADVAPLVAVTGALWLAMRETEKPKESVYETRSVVFI